MTDRVVWVVEAPFGDASAAPRRGLSLSQQRVYPLIRSSRSSSSTRLALRGGAQCIRQIQEQFRHGDPLAPLGRDGVDPVVRAGELAVDGGGGVGIVAQGGGGQASIREVIRAM